MKLPIISVHKGGSDNYDNLVILHKDVHTLIHATKEETIRKLIKQIRPDKAAMGKLNKYRNKLDLLSIER